MTNYTNIPTSVLKPQVFLAFIIEGSVLFVLDLAIAIMIISTKSLRCQKECILYFGNLFYDALFGIGYVIAGVYCLAIYTNEKYIPLATPWMCFNVFQNYLWFFLIPGMGLITLINATDRLISISFPIQYYQLTTKYSFVLILSPMLITFPLFIIEAFQVYNLKDKYVVPAICNIANGELPGIAYSLRWIRMVSTILAILAYVPITFRMCYVLHSSKSSNTQQRNLAKATITIGLLIVNEMVLIVIPDIVGYVMPNAVNIQIFYIAVLSKGLVDTFLVLSTRRELRKEILKTFGTLNQILFIQPL